MRRFVYSENYKEFARACGARYDLDRVIDIIRIDKDGDVYYLTENGDPTSLPKRGYEIVNE